jgi:hypothetical protein
LIPSTTKGRKEGSKGRREGKKEEGRKGGSRRREGEREQGRKKKSYIHEKSITLPISKKL